METEVLNYHDFSVSLSDSVYSEVSNDSALELPKKANSNAKKSASNRTGNSASSRIKKNVSTKKGLTKKQGPTDSVDSMVEIGTENSNVFGFAAGHSDALEKSVPSQFSKSKTIEETYTKMEQHEHILARPDMYIGSTRRITEELWVWNDELGMVRRPITYSPGLYKIFDEILVNAADNFQRDSKMTFIKVQIDSTSGTISVHNNGAGIPIEIHKKHGKYIPELIFGDLLTGSNFDDTEQKVTGGRNGLGAKLANIYSTNFFVETCSTNKEFKQKFSNNMKNREQPIISSARGRDYTRITFIPDFQRFDGMTGLDEDIIALFKKRVMDVAGCNSNLNVYLNNNQIPIKSFKDYVSLYFKNLPEEKRPQVIGPEVLFDHNGLKRWEIVFCVSEGEFSQISFVNSIWTIRGGNHVKEVVRRIVEFLQPKIKRKNRGTDLKPAMVRNHCFVFVNSLISNPEFDSQTKETLKSTMIQWGTKPEMSESFLNKIATKSGVIDQILLWNQGRSDKVLKTTSGKKKTRLGIVKLVDANNAGSSKSSKCTLIITEGESAKGLALSGLNVVGHDNYGIFPLRGKMLNVREKKTAEIVKNEELNLVKQAIGLQHEKDYQDVNSLRYGHVMIMTDQDHDGSHIKGLFINFIHSYWPSLIRIPGFLTEFITPIIKATKKDKTISFFTTIQYQEWVRKTTDIKGWKIKYYKGLGTSEPGEMQEYFSDLGRHKKEFKYVGSMDDEALVLAFSKDKADRRKEWLANFVPGTHLDESLAKIPYNEFINKELILYSLEDCERSIASLVDGLKPGQRKIMFACFKRRLKGEIKIAQLAGYVLEHCAYHHGETSLQATIVAMAQNFVGSNNLNFLEPIGNFGSRIQGGKDSAAARYIFTTLSLLTRYVFHPDDDEILEYLEEEGLLIQPKWYCPIIPTVLVNGNSGIGTGWSSFVPNYNPIDIVQNIRHLLRNEEVVPMHPWYRGFLGTIEYDSKKNNYIVRGCWNRLSEDCVEVTELPIGVWTQNYKSFLELCLSASEEQEKQDRALSSKKKKKQLDGEDEKKGGKKVVDTCEEVKTEKPTIFITDYKEYSLSTRVNFRIYSPEFANMSDEAIERSLKLVGHLSVLNMHLFNHQGSIRKYPSPEDILKDFFILRLEMYGKRRLWLIEQVDRDLRVLRNRLRFIRQVVDGEVKITNRPKAELFEQLERLKYDKIYKNIMKRKTEGHENVELLQGDQDVNEDVDEDMLTNGYDYLLGMPIWSLTLERIEKLEEQLLQKESERRLLVETHPADFWERDLDAFEDAWKRYELNMKILDEAGIGGCAFRKPKIPQPQGAEGGSIASKKKREEMIQKFKRLTVLEPFKNVKMDRSPRERSEIELPTVNYDPVIPKPKVKVKKEKGVSIKEEDSMAYGGEGVMGKSGMDDGVVGGVLTVERGGMRMEHLSDQARGDDDGRSLLVDCGWNKKVKSIEGSKTKSKAKKSPLETKNGSDSMKLDYYFGNETRDKNDRGNVIVGDGEKNREMELDDDDGRVETNKTTRIIGNGEKRSNMIEKRGGRLRGAKRLVSYAEGGDEDSLSFGDSITVKPEGQRKTLGLRAKKSVVIESKKRMNIEEDSEGSLGISDISDD